MCKFHKIIHSLVETLNCSFG